MRDDNTDLTPESITTTLMRFPVLLFTVNSGGELQE